MGTKAACAHSNNLTTSQSDPLSHTSRTSSREKVSGTRGTKIRENIFLQMDSQHVKLESGSVPSSGSTPLLSPYDFSLQPETSPFSGSRRAIVSCSSVLSAMTNIPTSDSLQESLSRSEERVGIDRAALAQKFSVTRRLFETKMMEGEASGAQFSKSFTGRGCKGIANGKAEEKGVVSQMGKGEEARHTHDGHPDKYTSVNLPSNHIPLPQTHTQASLTRHAVTPSDHDKCTPRTGLQTEKEGAESMTLDLCLTAEEPVRAELVDLKNESSESDENEEEKVQNETKLQVEGGKYIKTVAGENVQGLVDDVFEDPSLEAMEYIQENGVDLRAGDSVKVIQSEDHQKQSSDSISCETQVKGDWECGGDEYWQVNEQWEEQSRQIIGEAEKSATKGDCEERQRGAEESAGKERGMMSHEETDKEGELISLEKREGEEERTGKQEKGERDLQEECASEKVKGKGIMTGGHEDLTGSAVSCGTENQASVSEKISQSSPPIHSTPPREERESPTHAGSQLLLEYEEIPGVSELENEDAAEVAKRLVKFSSAPIKVRLFIIGLLVSKPCF